MLSIFSILESFFNENLSFLGTEKLFGDTGSMGLLFLFQLLCHTFSLVLGMMVPKEIYYFQK